MIGYTFSMEKGKSKKCFEAPKLLSLCHYPKEKNIPFENVTRSLFGFGGTLLYQCRVASAPFYTFCEVTEYFTCNVLTCIKSEDEKNGRGVHFCAKLPVMCVLTLKQVQTAFP